MKTYKKLLLMQFESSGKGNKQMKKEKTETNNSNRKEMKKLSRAELLDIIYEMKVNEENLRNMLTAAEDKLNKREILIEKSGSIAEASLALNDIFGAAQRAADTYIESLQARYKEIEEKCSTAEAERQQIISAAKTEAMQIKKKTQSECDGMIKKARQESEDMIEAAKADIKVREDAFKQVMKKMIEAGDELQKTIKRENG